MTTTPTPSGASAPVLPRDWAAALSRCGWSSTDTTETLDAAYDASSGAAVYPARSDVFRAIYLTPLADVRVVILGQDPYYDTPGKADGLAFSVQRGTAVPPSLRNVFRTIAAEYPGVLDGDRVDGDLTSWAAERGILLFNTALTVQHAKPASHVALWRGFSSAVLGVLRGRSSPTVFALWGNQAIALGDRANLNPSPHVVIRTPHPRPGAKRDGVTFANCAPFSQIDDALRAISGYGVDWSLPPRPSMP